MRELSLEEVRELKKSGVKLPLSVRRELYKQSKPVDEELQKPAESGIVEPQETIEQRDFTGDISAILEMQKVHIALNAQAMQAIGEVSSSVAELAKKRDEKKQWACTVGRDRRGQIATVNIEER
jgi:hypothetical protein